MKNTYIIPAMEISWFKSENIITVSSGFAEKTVNELQQKGSLTLDGKSEIDASQIISFKF